MKKLVMLKFLLCVFLVAPNLSARTKLSLGQGTMKAGGRMQMPVTIPREGSAVVGLDVSPNFDYFVSRSFSLGFSGSIERTSLTGENNPWSFLVGVNGAYHFDLGGALYPYLGAGGGISWASKVNNVEVKRTAFVLSAPVGLLIALNSHVAIDFGVPTKFLFNGDGYLGMVLPVGYLGVQAFF